VQLPKPGVQVGSLQAIPAQASALTELVLDVYPDQLGCMFSANAFV